MLHLQRVRTWKVHLCEKYIINVYYQLLCTIYQILSSISAQLRIYIQCVHFHLYVLTGA